MAPGLAHDGEADYICAYNILKAHAAVYHLYKTYELDGKQIDKEIRYFKV